MKRLKFFFIFLFWWSVFCQGFVFSPCLAACPRCRQPKTELQSLQEKLQEKRETLRERFTERRATVSSRISERKRQRVEAAFSRMSRRFEGAVARLEEIIKRIESRVLTAEENNEAIESLGIRQDLDQAKEKLSQVKEALKKAEESLDEILQSENPRENFVAIADLVKEIRSVLKEIRLILIRLIGNLKGLRIKN